MGSQIREIESAKDGKNTYPQELSTTREVKAQWNVEADGESTTDGGTCTNDNTRRSSFMSTPTDECVELSLQLNPH